MSRIGKLPVKLPQGVKVTVDGNMVEVEGAKGKLAQSFLPYITVNVDESAVVVQRINDSKKARAFHGLYRQLIYNMVEGVSSGFTKTLLINGVGYRAEINGNVLLLNLGYSNPIEFAIDSDVTVACDGQNKVTISGIDKQRVGKIAAEIRSLRPPEPYKGKGIKYEDETIRRKVGKSGVK